MEDTEQPLLQSCQNCATLIDISEQEPFELIHCPICGTSMRARTQIKNFTLQEVLGAGGMGAVYKAIDVNLNRMVALKVVRKEFSSDQEYLAKFEREAQITASVNHPHVVKVFSFGQDHGLFYIAMELVDKGSLDDLMNLQGRVAEAQVLEVGVQIAAGLHAAHQRGLIHRDVKPGNILFSDAHSAKITDFGLALLMEHEAESRGEVWGTPYYVAPEKLNQEPEDFRSDIYSLGGTLFHALAGRPPFEAETASLVALKHIKSQAVSLQAFAPDVSSASAYVINRMLHKDPGGRYQTYEELIEHLQYARAQLLENAGPREKTRVVVEGKEQQKVMAWLTIGLVSLFLCAGVLLFVFRDKVFKNQEDIVAAQEQQRLAVATTQYDGARKKLIEGDAEAAFRILHPMVDDTAAPLPQPLRNWVAYHAGVSGFLADHPAEAAAAFKKLLDRGVFSSEPEDRALANTFVDMGRLLSRPDPVSPDALKKFNRNNFQASALFAAGAKNWQLARFDMAAPLFKNFASGKPAAPFEWLAEYQPLAQRHVADHEMFKDVSQKVKTATTPEQLAAAMAAVQKGLSGAQTKGKIVEKLQELETGLKPRLSDAEATLQLQRTQEAAALAAVRGKFKSVCSEYRFAEARSLLAQVSIRDARLAVEKAALLKKADWLTAFKALLIRDVNASGYPQPLLRKGGGQIAGGVRLATENQLQVGTPYGFIPVPWAEVTPPCVLAMATHFRKLAGGVDADRAWLSGVFACELGLEREGKTLVVEASQLKEQYRNELGLFFATAERQ